MHVERTRLDFLGRALQRRLVHAHAVRELRLEQIIVPPRHVRDGFGQVRLFGGCEINEGARVPAWEDHGFEGPGGPEGAESEEGGVFEDKAFFLGGFEGGVVSEEVCATLLAAVSFQLGEFERGFLGEAGGGPDLAVRVRVGAAHGGAFVFEDLHVSVLCIFVALSRVNCGGEGCWGGEFSEGGGGGEVRGVDGGPGVNNREDFRGEEIGEGEVVR